MIFLDESGKRWRRIKRSAGFMGSTALLPILIILAASLLYLPSWGNFDLPKPFNVSQSKSPARKKPKSSDSSKDQEQRSVLAVSNTQDNTTTIEKSPDTLDSGQTSQPDSTETTPTPDTVVPETATPTQSGNSSTNQPTEAGNSSYGHSHQPTRF